MLGADRLGGIGGAHGHDLRQGADISVLDIRPGDWMVYDVLGAGLRVDRAVVPFVTVKKGQVFIPDWGPRPWLLLSRPVRLTIEDEKGR